MTDTYVLDVHASRRYDVDAAASTNDGFHGIDTLPLTITVASDPQPYTDEHQQVGPTADQWDAIYRWIAQYLDGRDLTGTLNFAPNARNLAIYLHRVFTAVAPSIARVTVNDGDTEFTAQTPA